jgi:hypothetical protein
MPTNRADLLYANGIDLDGNYLIPPVPARVVSAMAQGQVVDDATLMALRSQYEFKHAPTFGVVADANRLDQAGWGVLFAAEDEPCIADLKAAMAPLLERRKQQAGDRYFELTGPSAYRKGETKDTFLKRHKLGPGPVDPTKLPYYLLIVGDPRKIPFRFQYMLDVQFAVGRLHFDAPNERAMLDMYARYAESVSKAETLAEAGELALAPRAVLFGVQNENDKATRLSSNQLVGPLADELQGMHKDWDISACLGAKAKRDDLADHLGGKSTPALLFTASHGLGTRADDDRQLDLQGALVCSDWEGPSRPIERRAYFAAEDLDVSAKVFGLVAFHFACFGAGTPKLDDFSAQANREPNAPYDFIARLPQKLLCHPNGGALAVLGHIDRAWGCSFDWGTAGDQRAVFQKTLGAMLRGERVGAALEDFNIRYAEIATLLSDSLDDIRHGKIVDDWLLANYWTANTDARNYILLGDPAVRLPVAKQNTPVQERPALILATTSPSQASPKPLTSPASNDDGAGSDSKPSSSEHNFLVVPGQTDTSRQWMKELKALDPQLYEAWRDHLISGFANNDRMFGQVLDAFMKPYLLTVRMHWAIFAMGMAAIVVAIVLAVHTQSAMLTGIFGGIGLIAFASYFVNRPLQSLEENLEFITWLGMIYNTYWVQLFQANNPATIQNDLKSAMEDSSLRVKELIDKHDALRSKRPTPVQREG